MPVISGSCCGTVWYCTPTGPVEVVVGTSPPAGFTGGPWATAAEAAACPVPDVVFSGLGGCTPDPFTVPGAVYFNLISRTGILASLPNSVRIPITPGALPRTSIVTIGNFSFTVFITCSLVNRVDVQLSFQESPTPGSHGAGTSPWVVASGTRWDWWDLTTPFPGSAWALATPQTVGTYTASDGTSTMTLVVSR